MKKRKEQSEVVLQHLTRHPSITSQVAWRRFNITRLADVIMKLRRKGHVIITDLVPLGRTHYARYRLLAIKA
jgi:hypothetical protein